MTFQSRLQIFTLLFLIVFHSCDDSLDIEKEPLVTIIPTETIEEVGELMFKNDEPSTVLLSDQRAFYANKMVNVSVSEKEQGKLRLFNGVAHNFLNVTVLCKIENINKPIVLMILETLPAHYTVNLELPFSAGTKEFETEDGEVISIENTNSLPLSSYTLSLKCDDIVFQKLSQIKQKTYCQFNQFDVSNPNWTVTTPKRARYFTTAIANTAFVLSSDKLKEALLNYDKVLHDNNIKKDANGDITEYQEIDRMAYLEGLLNHKKWNLGVTKGVGGLGGGKTFGINYGYLENGNYEKLDGKAFPLVAWAHEFSHCRGYSHSSNMTYGNAIGSYTEIFVSVYKEMIRYGELPFSTLAIYPQKN